MPLVIGDDGERLAKSHGATTLRELAARDISVDRVVSWIATSLGLAAANEPMALADLIDRFDPAVIPHTVCRAPDFIRVAPPAG
jgi:glutamyl-tRNA synthetase